MGIVRQLTPSRGPHDVYVMQGVEIRKGVLITLSSHTEIRL
jgi:hypothetical protein